MIMTDTLVQPDLWGRVHPDEPQGPEPTDPAPANPDPVAVPDDDE
jgi:hypothetical protein